MKTIDKKQILITCMLEPNTTYAVVVDEGRLLRYVFEAMVRCLEEYTPDFKFNKATVSIMLPNGSRVIGLVGDRRTSDPHFSRFCSMEIDYLCIGPRGIDSLAVEALNSRIKHKDWEERRFRCFNF